MAREDTPLDQETFDTTLEAELAKGTDRRVAEGRARSAAVRAYRKAHGEEQPAPAAAAPAAQAPEPTSNGGTPAAQPAAVGAAAPAGAPAGAAVVTEPARVAPAPTGNVPQPKKGVQDKHRLLALVPPEGIQRVEREQGDRINVFPHLLIEEFVAMMVLFAALVIFSTFLNAPLREVANPNLTPNPSKAPWYFLGLQELLRYFHPLVAGITIPTFILVGLAAVPFVDRNPSNKPGDRKIAITLFTVLFVFGATLTIIGSFFRGPGYNWVWPWGCSSNCDPSRGLQRLHRGDHRRDRDRPVRDLLRSLVHARPATTTSPDATCCGRRGWRGSSEGAQAGLAARLLPAVTAGFAGPVRGPVRSGNDRVPVAEPPGRVRIGDQCRQRGRHQERDRLDRAAVLRRCRPLLRRAL
ncbi:MAG: hypothetical protein WEA54_01920 [Actinomycetota bacterium]